MANIQDFSGRAVFILRLIVFERYLIFINTANMKQYSKNKNYNTMLFLMILKCLGKAIK